MKHLKELPSSRAGGTGRVNSPRAELTPPWQVRLWLCNRRCPGSSKKRVTFSPVTFFEIIFNRLLHPISCLLSFPTQPRDKEVLLGVRCCLLTAAACLHLPAWGEWGNTAPVLRNAAPALPSSPPGTFPQPALIPSSVVVSSPFIYGVKSFLNLGGFFFFAASPKVNTSISV